jgi:hypothetical protein
LVATVLGWFKAIPKTFLMFKTPSYFPSYVSAKDKYEGAKNTMNARHRKYSVEPELSKKLQWHFFNNAMVKDDPFEVRKADPFLVFPLNTV